MYSLKKISQFIGGEIITNDKNLNIVGVCDIELGKKGCITYLRDKKYKKYLDKNKATAVIIDKNIKLIDSNKAIVRVENSYLSFVKLLEVFKVDKLLKNNTIHKSATISPKAKIGKNVSLAANVVIEDGVFLEDSVKIGSNTYIGQNSHIGFKTYIYPNVTIYDSVKIGQNCKIYAGTTIGTDGFGMIQKNNKNHDIPHLGGVMIGNNVTVGSNCCIDRGTINNTSIGDYTKLDNLIQIAHNVEIGKNCLISAQVGIAGSSKIGNNVIIAGQSGIIDHIAIGDDSIIAVKSCVFKTLRKKSFVSGIPAIDHKQHLKNEVLINKLSQIYKKVK